MIQSYLKYCEKLLAKEIRKIKIEELNSLKNTRLTNRDMFIITAETNLRINNLIEFFQNKKVSTTISEKAHHQNITNKINKLRKRLMRESSAKDIKDFLEYHGKLTMKT